MALLKKITFNDFKKFSSYQLAARPVNIITGPNNAGKSSILDSIRILQDIMRYSRRRNPTLHGQEDHGVRATYSMSHGNLSVTSQNFVRNYGYDPARICFTLNNDREIHIRLHPDEAVTAFLVTPLKPPRSSAAFRSECNLDIVVVPTLSPIEENEHFLADSTVEKNEFSRLSARNLRNILYRMEESRFKSLSALCSAAWEGVELMRPEVRPGAPPSLTMMYEENRIPKEIFWSGFGFQIWIQMMHQFLRSGPESILVLDEPDIYMHPELQKRMVFIAKSKFKQMFIATHSTEIINDADANEVLIVDAKNRSAKRISTDEDFRKALSYLGSTENADLSRISKADRIIFFEGKDRKILRKFASILRLSQVFEDPNTIHLQAGGFGHWNRVKETAWVLKSIFKINAKIAAIFDRDYRHDLEISSFAKNFQDEQIWIDIWDRKEIENYAIVREPLLKAISNRLISRNIILQDEEIEVIIEEVFGSFHEHCRAQIVARHLEQVAPSNSGIDKSTTLQEALKYFDSRWSSWDERAKMAPGKAFFSALSLLMQTKYQTTISINQVLEHFRVTDVPQKMEEVIDGISGFMGSGK